MSKLNTPEIQLNIIQPFIFFHVTRRKKYKTIQVMPVLKIYIHKRERTINWKDLLQKFNRCHLKMVK